MTGRDAVKLVYQNEFGCAHMMKNGQAYAVLEKEYNDADADIRARCVPIGNRRVRLPIALAKGLDVGCDMLFEMCAYSARRDGTAESYFEKIAEVIEACRDGQLPFSCDEIYELSKDCVPIGHSDAFRREYHPSYRVVDTAVQVILPIISKTQERMRQGKRTVIAIDGCAAAGKSTAAQALGALFRCSVVHADDFFLPKDMKTPERLAQAGGNIHYERLKYEVIDHLGKTFEYNVYDCSSGGFSGKREIAQSDVTVVEGSYCLHPHFGSYADIKVFLDIDEKTQKERILARSGEAMLARFVNEWIPMERRYDEFYKIKENCDITVDIQ